MKNHLSILEPTLSAHFKAINRAYQNTNIASSLNYMQLFRNILKIDI